MHNLAGCRGQLYTATSQERYGAGKGEAGERRKHGGNSERERKGGGGGWWEKMTQRWDGSDFTEVAATYTPTLTLTHLRVGHAPRSVLYSGCGAVYDYLVAVRPGRTAAGVRV